MPGVDKGPLDLPAHPGLLPTESTNWPRGELPSPAMPQLLTQNHEQMTVGFRRDLVMIPWLHYQKNYNQIPGSEQSAPLSQLHLLPQRKKTESLTM